MAVARRYTPDPVLVGDYAAEAAARPAARENVTRSLMAGSQSADRAQRGQMFNAQQWQHAADREAATTARREGTTANLLANQQDNATRLEEQDRAAQNRIGDAEMSSAIGARDKSMELFIPPDAADGAVQAHELALNNKRLLGMPQQLYEEELMKKAGAGDADALKQGMAAGILSYTPQQKQKIAELQDAMTQLDSPTLTPMDRIIGQRKIAAQLAAIRPVPVPGDQRTPSVEDRLNQTIGTWTNPIDGKSYPFTFDRSGVPQFLEVGKEKEQKPEEPKTISEKLKVDPVFRQKIISDAYGRVETRRKEEIAKAREAAMTTNDPALMAKVDSLSPVPAPEEVDAEIATMMQTEQLLEQRLGGGMRQTQTPQGGPVSGGATAPMGGQPGMTQTVPPDAPPPAVAAGIQAFASAAGLPTKPMTPSPNAPAGPTAPTQQPQGSAPAAKPAGRPVQIKPREGLGDKEITRMGGEFQRLINKAHAQGGKLSHNDAQYLKALATDLGIKL